MTMTNLITPTPVKPATFEIAGIGLADATAIALKAANPPYTRSGAMTLAFKDQRVTIGATDFETSVLIKLPVVGKKATTVSVDAALLAKFSKALKNETVTIDVTSDNVIMSGGELEFILPLFLDAPVIRMPEPVDPQPIDIDEFARAVTIAGAAAADDMARPIISAILFENGNAVATDSYRLVVVSNTVDFGKPALLPAKPAGIAVKALRGDVTFDIVDDVIRFSSGSVDISFRTTQGTFPNWSQLVPADQADAGFTIDRAQFADRLGKVALTGAATARMTVTDDGLEITMKEVDLASSKGGIPVEMIGHFPTVGLNPALLRQMLQVVGAPRVTVTAQDGLKPFVVTPVDETGWKVIQMPVRLPN